jgi:hypothetical protein
VNKKTLFLILLMAIMPLTVCAVNPVDKMVEGVMNIALSIGGAIVVIGWVIAGILYLTSMGSPEKTGTAKKAMIAAVIGTVLVVIAKLGFESIKALLTPIIGA